MRFKKIISGLLAAVLMAGTLPPVRTEAETLQDSGMDYTETVSTIQNPGMGYTSTLWYTCKPGDTPVKDPSGSLVLMFVDIGAFSSGINGTTAEDGTYTEGTDYDLDESFFAGLRGTLANCRANGATVALRFRYDANGKSYPEPATFEQVLHHIAQIKESGILEDYKDILMFVESGFVGAWGEQHSGKYTSLEYKAQLLDAVLDMTPDDIPVTVRTPNIFAKWAGIETSAIGEWVSEPGSEAARVGLYNDGYMGSDSDLGTYSNRAAETKWLGGQTASYYGGEFSGDLSWAQKYETYLPENAIPEMYLTHLSYINGNIYQLYKDYTFSEAYDIENVDNSAYYGQTVFQFIRDHLGYRFTVRDCDLNAACEQGGRFTMQFAVENTGFASPIRQQKAELILEQNGNYIVTDTDIDSRTWQSCKTASETLSVKIPGSLPVGEWNVYLRLSVGEQDVPDGNQRTVQFTNADIYNAAIGANRMGSITVTETTDTARKTDQIFSVNDCTAENAIPYTVQNIVIPDGALSCETEWTDDTLAAETETSRMWLTSDTQYLYVAAEIPHTVQPPVINIRIQNADTGKSYWYYRQSGGWVYFSNGSYDGIQLKFSGNFIEFQIPFGSVMDLQPGTKLDAVRIFLQDEANDWVNIGDITAKDYVIAPTCPLYTAYHEVTLHEGSSYRMRALTTAEGAAYTWLHDGEEVGTGEYFTLKQVAAADAGLYAVRITTPDGTEQMREICRVETVSAGLRGDLDLDGSVDVLDVRLLQDYLLLRDVSIPGNADLNGDGSWDVYDLAILKNLCS